MLKKVKNKLNNNDGVSILFALLMFLVAVVVAAIIISASLTAFKSVRNDFDEEQAYLTVESAEKLIESDIDGGILKVFMRETSNGTEYSADTSKLNDICRETITNMVISKLKGAEKLGKTVTIKASSGSGDDIEKMEDVTMTLSMADNWEDGEQNCTLTADFTIATQKKNRTMPVVSVVFDCDVREDAGNDAYIYTWKFKSITNTRILN